MSVVEFSPEWPKVRCTRCAEVYVATEREGIVVKGNCPRCGHGTFNTTMTVPDGGVVGEVRDS